MNYADEFPIATGPSDPNYDPASEQVGNLLKIIGLELYLALDKRAQAETKKDD